MAQKEFLDELRRALENDLTGNAVQDNVEYYRQYISEEIQKGKEEAEVLEELGDPWVIARTVIDALNGTDQSTVYREGSAGRSKYEEGERGRRENQQPHISGVGKLWRRFLLILAVIMVIMVIFAIISGLISILAPLLIPLFLVVIIARFLGNRRP